MKSSNCTQLHARHGFIGASRLISIFLPIVSHFFYINMNRSDILEHAMVIWRLLELVKYQIGIKIRIRMDILLTRMGVSVYVTVNLLLEIGTNGK
jgi:phage-related holin